MEELIASLTGYLHALRRLTKNQVLLSAHVSSRETLEKQTLHDWLCAENIQPLNLAVRRATGVEVQELFRKHVLNLCDLDNVQSELMEWDVFEYFGLIAQELNSDEFHPYLTNSKIASYTEASSRLKQHAIIVDIEQSVVILLIGRAN